MRNRRARIPPKGRANLVSCLYTNAAAPQWAHAADGNEWEEKWGENYDVGGKTTKYADKWGKQDNHVWHGATLG